METRTREIPVRTEKGPISLVWLTGIILQGLVSFAALSLGALLVYFDLQDGPRKLDGFYTIVGGVVVACGIAAVVWSFLAVKVAAHSALAAALMGLLLPLMIWSAVGPARFSDQPIFALAISGGLVVWLLISARFAMTQESNS